LYDFRFEFRALCLAHCRLLGETQAGMVTAMAAGEICEPFIK